MDFNNSATYQIKRTNHIIPILAIIVVIILITTITISIYKKLSISPKKTIASFMECIKNYNYDEFIKYIDFDSMIMFDSVNKNLESFNTNLNNSNDLSEFSKQIINESIQYKKDYFRSCIEQMKNDNAIFTIKNIEEFKVKDYSNINKVIVFLDMQNEDLSISEEMIFYTIKKDNSYYIFNFYGEVYF